MENTLLLLTLPWNLNVWKWFAMQYEEVKCFYYFQWEDKALNVGVQGENEGEWVGPGKAN